MAMMSLIVVHRAYQLVSISAFNARSIGLRYRSGGRAVYETGRCSLTTAPNNVDQLLLPIVMLLYLRWWSFNDARASGCSINVVDMIFMKYTVVAKVQILLSTCGGG